MPSQAWLDRNHLSYPCRSCALHSAARKATGHKPKIIVMFYHHVPLASTFRQHVRVVICVMNVEAKDSTDKVASGRDSNIGIYAKRKNDAEQCL
jgi:hypothetical protein